MKVILYYAHTLKKHYAFLVLISIKYFLSGIHELMLLVNWTYYNKSMNDLEIQIKALENKIDALQASVDKIRKLFFWTFVITAALFILPLVGLIFVIPQFLSTYSGAINGL